MGQKGIDREEKTETERARDGERSKRPSPSRGPGSGPTGGGWEIGGWPKAGREPSMESPEGTGASSSRRSIERTSSRVSGRRWRPYWPVAQEDATSKFQCHDGSVSLARALTLFRMVAW